MKITKYQQLRNRNRKRIKKTKKNSQFTPKNSFSAQQINDYKQLTEWIQNFQKLKRNKLYNQNQISQIFQYIEIKEQIFLQKSCKNQKLALKCKKKHDCCYLIQFQKYKRKELNFYKWKKGFHHPKSNSCLMNKQQLQIVKMKKYLKLVRQKFYKLIQTQTERKSPAQLLEQFIYIEQKSEKFLYKNLQGIYRTHLKKSFDNYINSLKAQILKQQQNNRNQSYQASEIIYKRKYRKCKSKNKLIKKKRKNNKTKKYYKKKIINHLKNQQNQNDLLNLEVQRQNQRYQRQQIQNQSNSSKNKQISNAENKEYDQIFLLESEYQKSKSNQHLIEKKSINQQFLQSQIKYEHQEGEDQQSNLIKQKYEIMFHTPKKINKQNRFDLQNSNQKFPLSYNEQKATKKSFEKFQRKLRFDSQEQINQPFYYPVLENLTLKTQPKCKKNNITQNFGIVNFSNNPLDLNDPTCKKHNSESKIQNMKLKKELKKLS